MFSSGSSNGDAICVNITIIDDNILEVDQFFILTLSTADENVILEEHEIVIGIIDQFNGSSSKCKVPLILFYILLSRSVCFCPCLD